MATSRPIRLSSARYTTPMPPRPRTPVISYLPIFLSSVASTVRRQGRVPPVSSSLLGRLQQHKSRCTQKAQFSSHLDYHGAASLRETPKKQQLWFCSKPPESSSKDSEHTTLNDGLMYKCTVTRSASQGPAK